MLVQVGQLVDFSLGLGGLRCDDRVLLACSRFDLDGDLLWAWGPGLVANVSRDTDDRNWSLRKFAERATGVCNSASAVGVCNRWKTTLCWPRSAVGGNSRFVDAGDLTVADVSYAQCRCPWSSDKGQTYGGETDVAGVKFVLAPAGDW